MHMSWVYFHSFIHISLAPLQVLYYSEALPTTARIYCIGVSRRSAQATAGKGLAQGSYMSDRAGVEPTTLRLKVIGSTKAPPRPRRIHSMERDLPMQRFCKPGEMCLHSASLYCIINIFVYWETRCQTAPGYMNKV